MIFRLKPFNRLLLLLLYLLLLSGCNTLPTEAQRQLSAQQLATAQQWQAHYIHTSHFELLSYQPIHPVKASLLTVYIEGDGLAWVTPDTISSNPTPINPTGLKLALADPQSNVAYLARPCQYIKESSSKLCNKSVWTDARFSEQVIASTNEALTNLKTQFGATKLQLVGFSGGGAVAALVAARRDDVVKLITVAGNIEPPVWTNYHHISPLSDSLNPANYRAQLAHIEQLHFVGANDSVMPPFIAKQFVAGYHHTVKAKVIVVPDFNHHCCWAAHWKSLLKQYNSPQKN